MLIDATQVKPSIKKNTMKKHEKIPKTTLKENTVLKICLNEKNGKNKNAQKTLGSTLVLETFIKVRKELNKEEIYQLISLLKVSQNRIKPNL